VFPTTQWGLVVAAAGRGEGTGERTALEELCRAYWEPVYACARRRGHGPDEARDMTQGFFAHVLERHVVAEADPTRGSFRAFLKTTFDHYASNEWRRSRARKRAPKDDLLSLDTDTAERRLRVEPVESETPENAFERQWARTLLSRALTQLEDEMTRDGQGARFARLSAFLTGAERTAPYREVASDLGLSESAVKVAVLRLRKRYGALLRAEIARTVADDDRVDDELRHVLGILGA
jgi:RNA polymerase sigma-70 factor (ECF subfamily)